MPVLDAKALEIDPQGAAFLQSVLRPLPALQASPKDAPRIGTDPLLRDEALARVHDRTA